MGWANDPNVNPRPFHWSAVGGSVEIGTFEGLAGGFGQALGVSARGAVTVGFATDVANRQRAFRWTPSVGNKYCYPAVPNSSGRTALICALGSAEVARNDVRLIAEALPSNTFGYFMTSSEEGSLYPIPGSAGKLCLAGAIGRFTAPGQVLSSGAAGSFSLRIDVTALPTPMGPVAAQVGQSWQFQAWFRDTSQTPTRPSNFTDGLSVRFE